MFVVVVMGGAGIGARSVLSLVVVVVVGGGPPHPATRVMPPNTTANAIIRAPDLCFFMLTSCFTGLSMSLTDCSRSLTAGGIASS